MLFCSEHITLRVQHTPELYIMGNHVTSRVSTLSKKQWKMYQSLRRIGFRPAAAYEIAIEWIEG